MADAADIANERAEQHLQDSLSARQRYQGESRERCIDCGEPIPEKRRCSIPGVQRCTECQAQAEAAGHA